jgi:RND superfamily putative drug exporter
MSDHVATPRPGVVGRIARWSVAHPRLVIVGWLVLLVIGVAVGKGIGNQFDNGLQLPSTDSQRAVSLLQTRFPSMSGDADQIVFAARSGKLTDAPTRGAIEAMLQRVAALPHVTDMSSPFGRGGAISAEATVGVATVRFDEAGDALPTDAIEQVVRTAQAIAGPRLEVELNGNAIEQLHRPSPGPATIVGIIAAVVILLLAFGSFTAMGLPILTALLGLGVGSAVIAIGTHLLTIPDFAQQIALMIGLGVGVDYALLIVTRFRDAYRRNGGNVPAAVEAAMSTAGRSITFAGLTVIIALGGLYALGVNLLYGVALAASTSVLFVLAASLTLLPAILNRHGHRVGAGRSRRQRHPSSEKTTRAERWVAAIQRRPATAALAATAVLLLLAAPALGLRLGIAGAGTDEQSLTTRKAYDLVAREFGPGFNGPLSIAVDASKPGSGDAVQRLVAAVSTTPDVVAVEPPEFSAARDAAVITAIPATAPDSADTYRLVKQLRDSVLPQALRGSSARAYVGGFTATQVDFTQRLSSKLPMFIAIVIALSALLLLIVFRSAVVPIQAAVMNLLSVAAALGIVQAVFERGWLADLFGIATGPIEPFLPVLLFAIVFGLSMDYEVFLVARIREEWQRSGDASTAIRSGLSQTARVITAAAAVMVAVFASFAGNGARVIQLFGLGLASAILLDAVVLRMILLPAVLQLFGNRTWRLPQWASQILPRINVEPETHGDRAAPETVATTP